MISISIHIFFLESFSLLSHFFFRITHQIIDRPKILGQPIIAREYVQPQWVYDCINIRALIPTEEYGVGKKLPPHLR